MLKRIFHSTSVKQGYSFELCIFFMLGNLLIMFWTPRVITCICIALLIVSILGTYRYFSTTMSSNGIKNLDFDQLKSALSNDKAYLIDVREKQELIDDGKLAHTVHIPLGEVETALQLPSEQYNAKYNYEKPSLETYLVFSCKSGRRSLMAANIAVKLGFKNVGNYMGGYLDWANHMKEQCS